MQNHVLWAWILIITFDTHKFIRKLRDAGFEEPQAEAVADAFKEATGEAELATKRDIESVEMRLKQGWKQWNTALQSSLVLLS